MHRSFRYSSWTVLLAAVIFSSVTLCASHNARAAVVCERALLPEAGLLQDVDWFGVGIIECRASSSCVPILTTEISSEHQPERDRKRVGRDELVFDSGIAPSSDSLSQAGGSSSGNTAIPGDDIFSNGDSLRVLLSRASKAILPRGPTFRYFRPPRDML